LKNIAGNDVAIFLFRFELLDSHRIDFVVNEAIGQIILRSPDHVWTF